MKFRCPVCRKRTIGWWQKMWLSPIGSTVCGNCHSTLTMGHMAFWIIVILGTLLAYPLALVILFLFIELGPVYGSFLVFLAVVICGVIALLLIPLRLKRERRI